MVVTMEQTDEILDAKAAARFIGVAVATLAKWRCIGGSPAFIKLGRKVGYRRSDLAEWLAARRVTNTTMAACVPRRLTDTVMD
jgi:predicted DNA-binding transcriptional regulator AlpA